MHMINKMKLFMSMALFKNEIKLIVAWKIPWGRKELDTTERISLSCNLGEESK